MSVEVITFGCRLNIFESEQIKKAASEAKLRDTVIINSCAVTSEAEKRLRQTLRKLHKDNPEKQIIVTGCAAQISPEKYEKFDGVVKVLGNTEKSKASSYQLGERVQVADIMEVADLQSDPISGFDGKARGYIQIQNGCNHRCTFCTIPYGRGNSRSLPVGQVVEQAQVLLRQGYQELVLTGVDMTDYGLDLPGQPKLGEMVQRLLSNVPNLSRVRLSSIDVAEVDPTLFDLIINDKRIMPHLHLSLQAGDNMILKRMKRRHNREQVVEFCRRVRALRPEVVFGADIIAGFPTETEAMFQNTFDIVQDAGLTYLHVFPYSERENTPASRMPQVDKAVRKQRAKLLRERGDLALNQHFNRMQGKECEAIVEQNGVGRLRDYSPIKIVSEGLNFEQIHGTRVRVKVIGLTPGRCLHCEIV